MQKIFTISFVFLSLAVISCNGKPTAEKATEDIIPVKTISLQQDSVQQEIYAAGQFTTDDETNLSFKNGGIVNRIYVKEGDAVKTGQLLATLHLTEINAQVEQTSLAYQKAQRDYQRASNLYKDSVATMEQMQNAKTALDIAKQQYTSAGFNQAYSEIRAGKTGFVLNKFVNEGQVVGAGTPILQINGAAQGKWLLKAGVSDLQWAAIKQGDKARITTDAFPGKSFAAVVSKKTEGIDPVSGTFIIQLQLTDATPGSIAAGLFGKAVITPALTSKAWAIPYDALLDGDANSGYVFITNDNQTAQKIKVQIAKVENEKVIVSAGLENVKALIVSGSAYLNDGSRIRLKGEGEKGN